MNARFNYAEIEERYGYFYEQARKNGERQLPYYGIQSWDQVLSPVELQVFHDIRAIGLPLYPIFPVAPGTYLHFANPFLRVGIDILSTESPSTFPAVTLPAAVTDRKRLLLRSQKWTIYAIANQYCFPTLEEFFRTKRTRDSIEFEELSRANQLRFFEKFHGQNITCLLEYIKYLHFEKAYV
jgi:hypothetical protein